MNYIKFSKIVRLVLVFVVIISNLNIAPIKTIAAGAGPAVIIDALVKKLLSCTPLPISPEEGFTPAPDFELASGIAGDTCVDIFISFQNSGTDPTNSVLVNLNLEDLGLGYVTEIVEVLHRSGFTPLRILSDTGSPAEWSWSDSTNILTISPYAVSGSMPGGRTDVIHVQAKIIPDDELPDSIGDLKRKFDVDAFVGTAPTDTEEGDTTLDQNTLYFNRKPVIQNISITKPVPPFTCTPPTACEVDNIILDDFFDHDHLALTINADDPDDLTTVFNYNLSSTGSACGPIPPELDGNNLVWEPTLTGNCTLSFSVTELNGNPDFADLDSESYQVDVNISAPGIPNVKPTAAITVDYDHDNTSTIPPSPSEELDNSRDIYLMGEDDSNPSDPNNPPPDEIETYRWTDLGASTPGFMDLPQIGGIGESNDAPFYEYAASTLPLGARYKVRLEVKDRNGDWSSPVDRIIKIITEPRPPRIDDPEDMLCDTGLSPPYPAPCWVKTGKNTYVTKDMTTIDVAGSTDPSATIVAAFKEGVNPDDYHCATSPNVPVQVTDVNSGKFFMSNLSGTPPGTPLHFPPDGKPNQPIEQGEHRYLLYTYKWKGVCGPSTVMLRSKTATRLTVTRDQNDPTYDTPVGIRFPTIVNVGGDNISHAPITSISGKMLPNPPGISTRVYVYVDECIGICDNVTPDSMRISPDSKIGTVSRDGNFNVKIKPIKDHPVAVYQIYLLFDKNTGATLFDDHDSFPPGITVKTDAPENNKYVNVQVLRHDEESPRECEGNPPATCPVQSVIAVKSGTLPVQIKTVEMFYFNSTDLPPKIRTTDLTKNLNDPDYFSNYPGSEWVSAGSGDGSEVTIDWDAPAILDEEQRFYALGFRVTHCPTTKSLSDPDCDDVTNVIHQSDGFYYPYIIDNGSGEGPVVERINGADMNPNEGNTPTAPIRFYDYEDPSPYFVGTYPDAIPGVEQKAGISIYPITSGSSSPPYQPILSSPLAIKRDIVISPSSRKWSWKYSYGATVHPLEIGPTYCLMLYRVIGSSAPDEGGCDKYFTIELAPLNENLIPGGYYINPKIADGTEKLKLEVLLTDEYGNVITNGGGTTVDVSSPYLPEDEQENIDNDQITPLFDESGVRTIDEDGLPLSTFAPAGSGKQMRYVGYVSSVAPSLDLTMDFNGQPNPTFGDSIRKAIGYGINVTIDDLTLDDRDTATMSTPVTALTQAEAFLESVPLVKMQTSDAVFFNTLATATPPQVHFNPSLDMQITHLLKEGDDLVEDEKFLVDGEEKIQFVTGDDEYFRITLTNKSPSPSPEGDIQLAHIPDTLALKSIIEFQNKNASFENVSIIGWRLDGVPFAYSATPEAGSVEFHNLRPTPIVLEPGQVLEIDLIATPAFKTRVLTTAGSIMSSLYYRIVNTNSLISIPNERVGLQILNPRGLIVDVPTEQPDQAQVTFTSLEKEITRNVEKATRDPSQDPALDNVRNTVGAETSMVVARTDGSGKMAFWKNTGSGSETLLDPATNEVPTFMGGSVYYFENTNVVFRSALLEDTHIVLPDKPTTIVVRGNVIIEKNLALPSGSSFGIIVLPAESSDLYPDPYSATSRNEGLPGGNIFIAPEVTGIQSDMFAMGAILSFDTTRSAANMFDLTSLDEALTATTGTLLPEDDRAAKLINQLDLEGLIASSNTWGGTLRDAPFGSDYDSLNRELDLSKARLFSTHMETPEDDVDGDGVLEQTPNDYDTSSGRIEAMRSFLLTGIDPGELNPRSYARYNLENPPIANFNSAVVVGRSELSAGIAPLFSVPQTLQVQQKKR